MKIVRRVLMALAVLLVLISAVGLIFFPSKIEVSRSIIILRQVNDVFDYVDDISKFNTWSPWFEKDTSAVYVMEGPSTGKGATLKWQSKNEEVGIGSFTTVDMKKPGLISREMRFMESGVAMVEYRFKAVEEGTELTWYMSVDVGANPLLRILGVLMYDRASADFDQGLNKLKDILEVTVAKESKIEVERAQVDVVYYMSVQAKATAEKMDSVLQAGYSKIMSEISKQGLKVAGPRFAVYNTPPPDFDLEIAIPVGMHGTSKGSVMARERKAGKVLLVRHFGPYEKTVFAHEAINRFVKENGVEVTGSPWESYVTGPDVEKDTALWETDIYYPIR